MCGRYIVKITAGIEQYFRLKDAPKPPWQESFNFAPTAQVPVVLERDGERVGTTMRWGLVPFYLRGDAKKAGSTHNARIETVATSPAYRGPWKRGQRCLQVASGFYEWHLGEDGKKQPFFIKPADRDTYAFAGLWDRSASEDGSTVIESVTHVTMPAPEGSQVFRIHNAGNPHRMPAILRQEDEDAWLHGTAEEARAVLLPYPDDLIVSWPVSTSVGNTRNNGPQLVEPAPLE